MRSSASSSIAVATVLFLSGCGTLLGADFDGSARTTDAADASTVELPTDPDGATPGVVDEDAAAPDGGAAIVPKPTPPDADGSCPKDRKLCDTVCVSIRDPKYGCDPLVCAKACATPDHGTATCTGDACTFTCDKDYGACPGADGTCTLLDTFYKDADKDGFGGATTTKACAAPAGYAALGGDCNDGNQNVHPGQTTEFTAGYTTADGGTSYDYDCSGAEETTGTAPNCTGLTCNSYEDRTDNPSCVPGNKCGAIVRDCVRTTAGVFEWQNTSIRRACR